MILSSIEHQKDLVSKYGKNHKSVHARMISFFSQQSQINQAYEELKHIKYVKDNALII